MAQDVTEFGELIGRPGQELVSEASLRTLAEHPDYAAAGDATLNVSGLRRDGSEFPAEIRLTRLPVDGGALSTIRH